MKKLLFSTLFIFFLVVAYASQKSDFTPYYKYRIWLKDKGDNVARWLRHPEKYLSERALERRLRQGFEVDVTDVPINSKYIKQIESAGLPVILRSKWNNTVVVQCEDAHFQHKHVTF